MNNRTMRNTYKVMKGIMLLTFVCLLIAVVSIVTPKIYAQDQQKHMVVLTPYAYMQDLDFFFDNSTYALGYYDGNAIDPSLFLSIVTSSQYKNLLREGYKPQVIDNNAGDISQYIELTNGRNPGETRELNKPEFMQKGLLMVYSLTRSKTLVKVLPGTQFSAFKFPGSNYYSQKEFTGSINRPTNRAYLREQLGVTENGGLAFKNSQKDFSAFYKLQWTVSLLGLLGIIGFVILMLRRKPVSK